MSDLTSNRFAEGRTVVAGIVRGLLGFAVALLVTSVAAQSVSLPIELGPSAPLPGSPAAISFRAGEAGVGWRLRCPFSVRALARGGWDFPVRLDLRRGQGISFKFRCPDATSVSYFSVYFKSGEGWYTGTFHPRADGEWETIRVLKSATTLEGVPNGWRPIEAIRLSAWRNDRRDTVFDIANFQVLPADERYLVIRGTTPPDGQAGADTRLAVQAAERVCRLLSNAGIDPCMVDEADVDLSVLSRAQVAILPYSPALPERAARHLSTHVSKGRKLLGFYTIHPLLQKVSGIQKTGYLRSADLAGGLARIAPRPALVGAPAGVPQRSWNIIGLRSTLDHGAILADWLDEAGDPVGHPALVRGQDTLWLSHLLLNGEQDEGGKFLLALVGYLYPESWRLAAAHGVRGIGSELPFRDLQEAGQALATASRADRVGLAALHQGVTMRQAAIDAFNNRDWLEAIRRAAEADRRFREAYYRTRKPVLDEFRGVWCHQAEGVAGWTWERSVRHLRNCGFTDIMPNVMNGNRAYFQSQVRRQGAGVGPDRDPLADCLKACRQYGIRCHAWVVCFRLDDATTSAEVDGLAAQGRLQVGADGSVNRRWLCPVSPANRSALIAAVVDLARRYPVDGIHLDYIRYPDLASGYTVAARGGFESWLGRRVGDWPGAVQGDGELAARWLVFRRLVISSLVEEIRAALNEVRPGIMLSAAVFADPETARVGVAQDWPAWLKAKALDFACTMTYMANGPALARLLGRQMAVSRATGRPVFPGIGLSTEELDAIGVVEQVETVRASGAQGFMIFQYDADSALQVFPHLPKGITAPTD